MVSASVALLRPEAHTWLSVSVVSEKGSPAWKLAWRDGICPTPACTTMPKMECCRSPSSMPERSMASLIAAPLGGAKGGQCAAEPAEGRPRRPEDYRTFQRDSSVSKTNDHSLSLPVTKRAFRQTAQPPQGCD